MRALIPLCLWWPLTARAQDTGLQFLLLAEASNSIDACEIALRREGYFRAITGPRVLSAIAGTANGEIAVTYVGWAANPAVVVEWARISGPEKACRFAEAVARTLVLDILGTHGLPRRVGR